MLPASEEGFIRSSEFDHLLCFRFRHCEREEQSSGVCVSLSPSVGEERNYANNTKGGVKPRNKNIYFFSIFEFG